MRHARNVEVHQAELRAAAPEGRPPVVLDDVAGARFAGLHAGHAADVPTFLLRAVRNFTVSDAEGLADVRAADYKDARL